jgi:anti-sigma B factor antagonist
MDDQGTKTTDHLEFSVSVAEGPDGGTVVTIFGELDLGSAPALRQALDQAIAHPGRVALDRRGCSFIDSTGIATVVGAARQLRDDGRALQIRGARERVRRILELAGLLSHQWIVLEPEQGTG